MAQYRLQRPMTDYMGGIVDNGSVIEIGDRTPDWFMIPLEEGSTLPPDDSRLHLPFGPI